MLIEKNIFNFCCTDKQEIHKNVVSRVTNLSFQSVFELLKQPARMHMNSLSIKSPVFIVQVIDYNF